MPSLIDPIFPPLIRALPVASHAITVDAVFWQPKFAAAGQSKLWSTIFGTAASIRLSRSRLQNFAYPTGEQKCAEILLWGYPNDKRGLASRLLKHLPSLSKHASSTDPWPRYFDEFPKGAGISTITKLAYFYHRKFDGYNALILDWRLIENTANWKEVALPKLKYNNAEDHYIEYLRVMHSAAANPALKCSPEQLEFFLFELGDSY